MGSGTCVQPASRASATNPRYQSTPAAHASCSRTIRPHLRAVWESLRFAASQRGNTIITSVMGYVPQRDDVVDDPKYLKPYLDQEPHILPAIRQLGNLEPWLSWPGSNAPQAVDVFMTASQNLLTNGQDAQSSMDAAAQRVDELLDAR